MHPEIRTMHPMRTLYAEGKGVVNGSFSQAAGIAFGTMNAYLGRHNLWHRLGLCIGYMPDDMMSGSEADWRYQAHWVLMDSDPIPPDPQVHEAILDIGRVAVFQHRGPYDTLGETWGRVMNEWFPISGLTMRHAPVCEIYISNPNNTPPDEMLTEICVPIV